MAGSLDVSARPSEGPAQSPTRSRSEGVIRMSSASLVSMPWIVALGAVDGSAVVALTARGADAAQTQSLGAAVVALLTEVVGVHALDRGLVIRRARHGCAIATTEATTIRTILWISINPNRKSILYFGMTSLAM